MADWNELPLKYRLLMRAYPWRRISPTPWAPLRRPLAEARIALVSSAGLYRAGIDRDFGTREGEDISVRWLPHDVAGASLTMGQTSDAFDRTAIEADVELALPLTRLSELVAAGEVGSVAPRHVSFNGSMLSTGRFLRDSAPEVAEGLSINAVDAALFVPV